jgi:hypothetical protein
METGMGIGMFLLKPGDIFEAAGTHYLTTPYDSWHVGALVLSNGAPRPGLVYPIGRIGSPDWRLVEEVWYEFDYVSACLDIYGSPFVSRVNGEEMMLVRSSDSRVFNLVDGNELPPSGRREVGESVFYRFVWPGER